MNPNIKFAVNCECGEIVWVSRTDAGSSTKCAACGNSLLVPNLSMLLKAPSVDASPLGIVIDKIRNADPPFDGTCQVCSSTTSEIVWPVELDFVPKEQMVSADSEATIESCILPCYLCYGCEKTLRRSMWVGFAQQLVQVLFNSFWLLFAFVLAVIVALILPMVGLGFVIAVVWGLYQQLTRRKANPALLKHFDRVCGLGEIVKQAYYYKLTPQKRQRRES